MKSTKTHKKKINIMDNINLNNISIIQINISLIINSTIPHGIYNKHHAKIAHRKHK